MPTETVPGPSGDLSRNSTAGDVSNWNHRLLPSLAPGSFISSRGSHRLVSSCRCARAFRCLPRAFYNLSMLAMRGEIRVNRLQVIIRSGRRSTRPGIHQLGLCSSPATLDAPILGHGQRRHRAGRHAECPRMSVN